MQDSILAVTRARQELALADKFVATSRERSAAKQELDQIPTDERLESLCLGCKPPPALSQGLQPDEQAIAQAVDKDAALKAEKDAFFGRRPIGKPIKVSPERGGRYENAKP